jgi:hypothetical protein
MMSGHILRSNSPQSRIDGAWDMRGELRSRIEEHLPPMIERAGKTVDVAADLIRSAVGTR